MKRVFLLITITLLLAGLTACGRAKDVSWDCVCGSKGNTGNFCPNCGVESPIWVCPSCSTTNIDNYCTKCGQESPDIAAEREQAESAAETEKLNRENYERMKRAYSIGDYEAAYEYAKQLETSDYEEVPVYTILSMLHNGTMSFKEIDSKYDVYDILIENLDINDAGKAILYNKDLTLMYLNGKWRAENGDIVTIEDNNITITFKKDDTNEETSERKTDIIGLSAMYIFERGLHTKDAEEAIARAKAKFPYNGTNSDLYKEEPYTWLKRKIEKVSWGIINPETDELQTSIEVIDKNHCKYHNCEKCLIDNKLANHIYTYELERINEE